MTFRQELRGFADRLLSRSEISAEAERALLSLKGRMVQLEPRRDLQLDRPPRSVGIVVNGTVAAFDQLDNGRRQATSIFIKGDACNLQSLVFAERVERLSSASEAAILCIPHANLQQLMQTQPEIATAFWRDCAADLSVATKWMTNVGRKDASGRVAHLLCELGVRNEMAGLGTRFSYRSDITQELIGDATGLTAVHVSRMLKQLYERGVLLRRRSRIEIRDWERLATIGEFDISYLGLSDGRWGEPQTVQRVRLG